MMKSMLGLIIGTLLVGPAIAQVHNGPRMGLDGSIHSPSSSYAVDGTTGIAAFNGLGVTSPGPAWANYSKVFNANHFDIGGYPLNYRYGGNTLGLPEALVGTLVIPSTSAAGGSFGSGVSGYAISASTATPAVGVFGYGGVTANGASAWGGDFLVQNCPGAASCASNTGYQGGDLYGVEIDMNIDKYAGAAPSLAARGLYIIGASEVIPTSPTFYGIDIDSPGIGQTPRLLWNSAIRIEDGSATSAFNVGTQYVGNNVGSIPIVMNSRTSAGTPLQATLATDSAGNVALTAPAGSASAIGATGQCALKAVAGNFNQSTCSLYNNGFYRPGITTVALLGSIDGSPQAGDTITVSDATSCTANSTVVGGGSTSCALIYSGAAWKAIVTH